MDAVESDSIDRNRMLAFAAELASLSGGLCSATSELFSALPEAQRSKAAVKPIRRALWPASSDMPDPVSDGGGLRNNFLSVELVKEHIPAIVESAWIERLDPAEHA